jgi:hypothetical protein
MTPADQLAPTVETLLQAIRLVLEFQEELAFVLKETEVLAADERTAARDAFADAWSPLVDPIMVKVDRLIAEASAGA